MADSDYQNQINQIRQAYQQSMSQLSARQAGAIGTTYPSGGGAGGGGIASLIPNNLPGGTMQGQSQRDINGNTIKAKPKDLSIAELRRVLDKVLKTDIVPFLWGPPGVGKSSLVRDICKDNGWDLIDLRLSLLNPVDLRGLPMLDKEHEKARWLPPSFLPNGKNVKPGILFLDEINLAPLSVQAAAYQLILDKKVGEYVFPSHWKIIAAGNRETDRANVYKISAPLANRFIHFTVRPDIASWKAWAFGKVRPEIAEWLYMRPAILLQMPNDVEKAFPSPRSWSFVSSLLDAFEYDSDQDLPEELEQAIFGAIGEGAGKEFISYLTDYNVKDVSRKVQQFINTGVIEMPKQQSLRITFIRAAFHAYKTGKVSETKYQLFLNKISNEEREAIIKFEKENADKLYEKYNKIVPDTTKEVAIANSDIAKDSPGFILDRDLFKGEKKKCILFNGQNDVELIEATGISSNTVEINVRGMQGTRIMNWPKGTYVQLL